MDRCWLKAKSLLNKSAWTSMVGQTTAFRGSLSSPPPGLPFPEVHCLWAQLFWFLPMCVEATLTLVPSHRLNVQLSGAAQGAAAGTQGDLLSKLPEAWSGRSLLPSRGHGRPLCTFHCWLRWPLPQGPGKPELLSEEG